jgi:hypothetical protein
MRWWWTVYYITRNWARDPRRCFYDLMKWVNRPLIGDMIEDCRYQHHRVIGHLNGLEDDLILDDGSHCSWMNCGDHLL